MDLFANIVLGFQAALTPVNLFYCGVGVFVGTLRHRRHAPIPHAFTAPLFMVLLDIDRIADQIFA